MVYNIIIIKYYNFKIWRLKQMKKLIIKKCPNCYKHFREIDLKKEDGILKCPNCDTTIIKDDSGEYEILDD